MKKLLAKLILFTIPIVTIALTIELTLRNLPNDYKIKAARYDKISSKLELLCLGSSHAYYSINPQFLSYRSFNGSHVAQSLDLDLMILNRHKEKLTNLKYLLIPVSYLTFSTSLESGAESWRMKNYNLYYDHLCFSPKIQNHSEILSSPFKSVLNRLKSHYYYHQDPVITDSLGFGTNYRSNFKVDLTESGKIAARKHTSKNKDHFERNISTLQEIINICAKKNIKIILFTPPAYESYRKLIDTVQLNTTIRIAEKFSKDNSHVFYLNAFDDANFTSHDYYDADHLNEIGAEKFTRKIDKFIHLKTGMVLAKK